MIKVNENRIRTLSRNEPGKGPVVYWMSRDQRVQDNWALLHAQERALELRRPLLVIFCLVPSFLGATMRQYGFMIRGLEETEERLRGKNIPFILLPGDPEEQIPRFVARERISVLVKDFDPLKIKRIWKTSVSGKIAIPFFEVDTHNIVPCWIASDKMEYAAYTIRPKIRKHLSEFLEPFPRIRKHPHRFNRKTGRINWERVRANIIADRTVPEVSWINPGEKEAARALKKFISKKASDYAKTRNDPTLDGQSGLSPWIHFGHLSAQRVALDMMEGAVSRDSREAFLEELIIRRELSDNFCLYNGKFDSFDGFPEWARKTLDKHRNDKREYVYGLKKFENAETHDPLWNAAQIEMVTTGKMHGYMRMYWAKKILEWTGSPEAAMKIAIYLNDRYEMDGRDPNGYAGISWSIGGVHDRAWGERPVFGKIRYMSYAGARSKFDVKAYIERFSS